MKWLTNRTIDGNAWVKVVEGNIPLLLSFAHAGTKRVPGISLGIENNKAQTRRKDPQLGGCKYNNSITDVRTFEIAEAILEHLEWQGFRPFMVVPLVSRRDVDLNRSWNHNRRGYQLGGVANDSMVLAGSIYNLFHDSVQLYINQIQAIFSSSDSNRALYIDFHGTKLGEGIDIEIGTKDKKSAQEKLVYQDPDGATTLIESLQTEGFNFRLDALLKEEKNGCYILKNFGLEGVGFQAVQIEISTALRCCKPPRNATEKQYEERVETARKTGQRIALSLQKFIIDNGYEVKLEPTSTTKDKDHFLFFS